MGICYMQVGKMKQILCSDWLPEWARWDYLARSGFPRFVPAKAKFFGVSIGHIINPLLSKLGQSRWLDTLSQSIKMQKKNLAKI